MILEIADKLREMSCDYNDHLKQQLDEINYGLKPCKSSSNTCMDINSKFYKLKKDFLEYYLNYNTQQLLEIKDKCDILNIIKKL